MGVIAQFIGQYNRPRDISLRVTKKTFDILLCLVYSCRQQVVALDHISKQTGDRL